MGGIVVLIIHKPGFSAFTINMRASMSESNKNLQKIIHCNAKFHVMVIEQ